MGGFISGVIAGVCFGMSWVCGVADLGLAARAGWGVAAILALLLMFDSFKPEELEKDRDKDERE